jgi:predicted transcriptional regulator
MRDLSDFQRGQIVGVCLARVSATTKATLLGLSRAAVSKVITAYTNHGKTSSAKRNSGQKPKLNERVHRTLKRIVYKNRRTTAANMKIELSVHLEDPVSTQAFDESFTILTLTVDLQLLNFQLLKTVLKGEKMA